MSLWRLISVLACVGLISVGQILFKYAALQGDPKAGVGALVRNPYLILAGVIYVGATFLWVWQLKYIPLNRAYPLFATAFVFVPLLSWWIFGERIGPIYAIGVALIVLGVTLCARFY
jgi:drug/metabolite transporter (DMT)-like permease